MIIIGTGDSFTFGDELWEEQHPHISQVNYEIEYHKKSDKEFDEFIRTSTSKGNFSVLREKKRISFIEVKEMVKNERQLLAWPHQIGIRLGITSNNLGRSGGSNMSAVLRAMEKIHTIRNITDEKIICILQTASDSRVWLNIDGLQADYIIQNIYFPEISHIYMKYDDSDRMHLENKMQSLALKRFCESNNVCFFCFNIGDMITRLNSQFDDILLPYGHINCDSQKIMSQWIIDDMKLQGII